MKAKKTLTRQEEFEIMKLVLDKFLWLGVGIMAVGFYFLIKNADFWQGFSFLVSGALVLIIFLVILLREYKIVK